MYQQNQGSPPPTAGSAIPPAPEPHYCGGSFGDSGFVPERDGPIALVQHRTNPQDPASRAELSTPATVTRVTGGHGRARGRERRSRPARRTTRKTTSGRSPDDPSDPEPPRPLAWSFASEPGDAHAVETAFLEVLRQRTGRAWQIGGAR